ncbi:MAG: hypothetical protein KBD66_01350 [Candidatus Doudnabacteria bacterium]|nr:hypothetical protein [Candidatus Doudnabacteria bacterium]
MAEAVNSKTRSLRLISLAAAVFLPLGVYVFSVPNPVFRFSIPFFVGGVLLVEGASWVVLGNALEARPWILMRSALFYTAWLCTFFLVPSSALLWWYVLCSVPILYLGHSLVAYTGETVLISHTILTSFGILLAAAAGEYYFKAGSLLLTTLVFVSLLLLVRATYVFVPQQSAVRLSASLLVALFATECYAALLFLPFHYTVIGFLAFLVFYVIWLCAYYWQFNVLSAKKVQFYVLFALVLALVVLLVTPWHIVS